MKSVTLIFPFQLFKEHPALEEGRRVFLVEEFLYFRVQPFHKQKLVLLRASMIEYAAFLKKRDYRVTYIDSEKLKKRASVFAALAKEGIEELHLCQFDDDWLRRDLEKARMKVEFYKSPMFLGEENELRRFFKGKERFSMASFYAYQRKKLGILMSGGKPEGGKYSFDKENRSRFPKGKQIPLAYRPPLSKAVKDAIKYVEKFFPHAIGEAKPFNYPCNFEDASRALDDFVKHRLKWFGDYEDAIVQGAPCLFHSMLSPLLNIGLLTPAQVIEKVLACYAKRQAPLNCVEGFVRQIIGWREFLRATYLLKGKRMRLGKGLGHKRELPKGVWEGKTGVTPVDDAIEQLLKIGYCHHIVRLMVLGSFFFMIEADPDLVYEWFMAFFIDAYDWVMVPNVYGMSQYVDRTITTKPYLSGSNYLLKMSDYPKGDWCKLWDGLFWRSIEKHKKLFMKNPRTGVLVHLLNKNSKAIQDKIALAEKWLILTKSA